MDQNIHACPMHNVPMVPTRDYEPGPIRPREEGPSSAYPILKCPEPGCTERWMAAEEQ
jgi:hypothetical protein